MTDVENAVPNVATVPRPFTPKTKWNASLKGALVEVTFKELNRVKGFVRWVGTAGFASGKFIGVELQDPLGKKKAKCKQPLIYFNEC